ncbi:MAG TPA: hypothetical protein VJ843_03595 [Candidatus Saccharimonadales bacterium]|nr:hypothetical protein [Candidatus Saccharimonadales bacterium]
MSHLVRAINLAAVDNRAFKLEDHPVFCIVSIVVFAAGVIYLWRKKSS